MDPLTFGFRAGDNIRESHSLQRHSLICAGFAQEGWNGDAESQVLQKHRSARRGPAALLPAGLVLGFTLALAAWMPVASTAQGTLDPPSVRVVESSPATFTVEVTAGPSSMPGGFTVEWMPRVDYDRSGWPSDGSVNRRQWAVFDGEPIFKTSDNSDTYRLFRGVAMNVYIGELFDEDGTNASSVDELPPATEFAVRVRAESDGISAASAYSPTQFVVTRPLVNCTFTQGYWKNHPSAWPVSSLTLGTVTYTKTQLLSILGQPSQGNGLTILAHQLIAAKLNVAQGATAPAGGLIGQADALIGNLVVPPVGNGYLDPGTVNSVSNDLDDYNNGRSGVPHCGQTPTHKTSWGAIKQLYR